MSATVAALTLAWIAVFLLALAAAGLLRRIEALEHRREHDTHVVGDSVGLALPARYQVLLSDRDSLLVVVSPTCATCHAAVARLTTLPTGVSGVLVSASGSLGDLQTPDGWRQHLNASDLIASLGVPGTPWAVHVDEQGTILSSQPMGEHWDPVSLSPSGATLVRGTD